MNIKIRKKLPKDDPLQELFPFDFLEAGLNGEVELVSTEGRIPGLRAFSTVYERASFTS